MTSLALATLLHASVLATGDDDYARAHREAEAGKPLVVMVSAEWCGPCQQMKKTVIPQVRKQGLLKKVAFAIVNVDRERKLAQKLIGNGSVPQLILFRRTSNGWTRNRLVGGQNLDTVEKFISRGIAQEDSDKEPAAEGPQGPPPETRESAENAAGKPEILTVSSR